MLDNPYQQGIDAGVVRAVLKDVAEAARATGTQVITTQAVSASFAAEMIREVKMPKVYEAS